MGKKSKMKMKQNSNKKVSVISSSKLINYSKVSILLVTQRKRINFLELFMENLFNQTKLNLVTEIIIINGSPNELEHDELELFILSQMKPLFEEKHILLKYVPTKKLNIWKKIGAYRNLANKEAEGDFFLWMDDDDYYHPEYIEEALLCWKKNNHQLVGCSANYIFDHYYNKVFKCSGFGPNHTINCVLGYTKEYGKTHQYENHKERGEEKFFLENYKNSMEQMNPKKTILQFSHGKNTFNKNKLFDTNILGKLLEKDVKIEPDSSKLENLIPLEIAKKYLTLFEDELEQIKFENDITIYLGSQEELTLDGFLWLEEIINKEFTDNIIEIFGIYSDKSEIEEYLEKNKKIRLYNFDEFNNRTKIHNLWLHNITSLIPYFKVNDIKLSYEKLFFSVTKIDQLVLNNIPSNLDKFWVNHNKLKELLKLPNIQVVNKPKINNFIEHWKNPNKIVIVRELDEFLLYFLQITMKVLRENNPTVEMIILFRNEILQPNIAQQLISTLAQSNIMTKKYNTLKDIMDEIKSANIFLDLPGNPNDFENAFLRYAIRYRTIPIVPEAGSYLDYKVPNFMYDLRKPKNIGALAEMINNLMMDKDYQKILRNKLNNFIHFN